MKLGMQVGNIMTSDATAAVRVIGATASVLTIIVAVTSFIAKPD